MKLDDILEIKAKEYYDKSESIIKNRRASQVKYDELMPKKHACETLLNVLVGKIDSSFKLNIDSVCSLLLEYGYGNIKNNLNNIIVTLNAIKNGLPVELTHEQKNELNTYISNLKNLIEQMNVKMNEYKIIINSGKNEYDVLAEKYLSIECLIEKIKDPDNLDLLDENDFQIVYDIVSSSDDLSFNTRSQMLIQFKEYNEKRANKETKEGKIIPFEDIVKFFKDNGLSEGFIKNSKKHKNEIEKKINLTNALEIIEYLKSVKIKSLSLMDYFSNPTLLTLLVYGNKETIMQRYEQLSMDGKLYQIFFDTSSVWMKTLNKGESKTNRKSSTHTPGSADVGTLKYDSQIISYDDMIENERFLKSKGFPVSLNESINYKILKTNPNKLKSNYEIYRKYGFFEVAKKTPLSMLGACRLLERCDLCVELGILNGVDTNERECNLIKYSPTRLVNSPKGFFQYLAKLKLNSRPHEYYGIICSNKDSFAFNTITSQMQLQGLGTSCNDEKIEEFEHNNFVDVKEEIPNYYKYESLVSAINTDSYDKNVLSLPLIDKLETENKKNEFVYKFGEQIISRQKVLRISSVLNKCLKEFNEEMLFFAITKGSYINEEVLSKIKSDISYSFEGGVTHGLS